MNANELRDFIKTLLPKFDKYYAGKLDNKYEKSICVYSRDVLNHRDIAIGGKANTKIETYGFTILIHYNKNYTDTEKVSKTLFEKLAETREINNSPVYIQMETSEPVDIHTDDGGVYERVIDIKIFKNKK